MKTIYKISLSAIMALSLASCSVESPFQSQIADGYGELSKSALNLEVSGEKATTTRAKENVDLNDFTIVIQTSGNNSSTKYSEKYGDLPDIIPLEAGKYIVTATYGENPEAEFESPHYFGSSDVFEVKKDEITTSIGKIKCFLNNIKVSIKFHPTLVQHMEEGAYVEVKVNDNGKPLKYEISHSDNEIAGYFQHKDESSLVATFHGVVDGVELNEVKTLSNVDKGNHYKITFVRHEYNGEDSGQVSGKVGVNASVEITDIDSDIKIQDDVLLDDKERPSEDSQNQPGNDPSEDDPQNPDDPTSEPGPQAKLDKSSTVVLGKDYKNEIDENTVVVMNIHSNIGLDKFKVSVESESLDLADINATGGYLDLIEPQNEELLGSLHQLGLLPDSKDSLKGEKDVVFDISKFMSLIMILGTGEHLFVIELGDSEGENTIYLNLSYTDPSDL